jgi:hypothetical protein
MFSRIAIGIIFKTTFMHCFADEIIIYVVYSTVFTTVNYYLLKLIHFDLTIYQTLNIMVRIYATIIVKTSDNFSN